MSDPLSSFLTQVQVLKSHTPHPALLTLTPAALQLDYLSSKKTTSVYPIAHVIGALFDVEAPTRFKVAFYTAKSTEYIHIECQSTAECSDWVQRILQYAYPGPNSDRRIAIIVNPVSGRKKAVKMFNKHLLPMLEYAAVSCSYFETDSPEFMANWCQNTDLSLYSEIVIFGGDGLLNQLLNGLAARNRLDLPIGVIPAGSQNALACAIGNKHPSTACLHAIKGVRCKADLLKISLDGRVIVASSAVAWGLVSDIVLEAQTMRKYGPAVLPRQRYTLCGLKKMVTPWKEYKAKVKFVLADSGNIDTLGDVEESDGDWKEVEGPYELVAIVNHPCPSSLSSDILAPAARVDDGLIDLLAVFSGGRIKMMKVLVGMRVICMQRKGKHVKMQDLVYCKVKAVCIEPETTNWFNIDGEPYQADRLIVEVLAQGVTYLGCPQPPPPSSLV